MKQKKDWASILRGLGHKTRKNNGRSGRKRGLSYLVGDRHSTVNPLTGLPRNMICLCAKGKAEGRKWKKCCLLKQKPFIDSENAAEAFALKKTLKQDRRIRLGFA